MNKIFCNVNLFDLNQNIFIVDTVNGTMNSVKEISNLNNLAPAIFALSQETSISKIILSGDVSFNTRLKNEIIAYSKSNYSENNLEIEVI